MKKTTIHNAGIPKRKTRWGSVAFLVTLTLVTLVGCPIYLYYMDGLSLFLGVLTLCYIFLTTMAITAGYHRLYAHTTYKAHPVYHFLMLFFGAATFQQSALKWASLHRTHHRYTDPQRRYSQTKDPMGQRGLFGHPDPRDTGGVSYLFILYGWTLSLFRSPDALLHLPDNHGDYGGLPPALCAYDL